MVAAMSRKEFDKKELDIDENMIYERSNIVITADKQVYLVGQRIAINLTKTNRDFVGTLAHTKKEWQSMIGTTNIYEWMKDDKIYTSISFGGYGFVFEDKQTAYNFRDAILTFYLDMLAKKEERK